MGEGRIILILTEVYLIHYVAPKKSVLINDMGRDFRIQKVLIIYPCGYIDRTSFEELPRLCKIGIEHHKPVIENLKKEEEQQQQVLSEIIKTPEGFIVPLAEIIKLLRGSEAGWRVENNVLKNEELGVEIPRKTLEYLEQVPEAKSTLLGASLN